MTSVDSQRYYWQGYGDIRLTVKNLPLQHPAPDLGQPQDTAESSG